ncbi:MAG: ABC transporter substrate-binding protein [Limnochordia bacterium]|jgi:peptide/nickel transport system substrate-binding protein
MGRLVRVVIVSLAVALLLSGVGCAKGRLVVGVPADVDGLDPHRTVAAATFQVVCNIYDTLVEVTPDGRLVPGLAASWELSPDGLQYTFTLHRGIKVHTGRELRGADVAASFRRILDPDTNHPRAADYRVIDSIETPDAETVIFHLKEKSPAFLSNLAMGWAAVVPPEAVGEAKFRPIGTGPFMFADWVPDSHLILRRFADYFRPGEPLLEEVVFRVIPEPSVGIINLKTGAVDVLSWLAPQDVAGVKADPRTKVVESPMNGIYLLAMNNARPPLNDRRVRQAINLAIDKQAIVDGVHWGQGRVIGSHMPPVSPFYVDLTAMYPYDPEKARQLLAEAGYEQGLELSITLPQPYDFHIRNGEIIAQQLEKVGIRVRLEVMEWGNWLDRVYFGQDYQAATIGHTGRLDPDPFLNRYASDSRENYMNYQNPDYDELVELGGVTLDMDERLRIYRRLQEILAEDAVAVYLMSPNLAVGMKANVSGWQIYPIDILNLRRVYKEE